MLNPYHHSRSQNQVRPVRPASALGAPMGRSMEQLSTSASSLTQQSSQRHRLSRPLSQELERLAEFIEEDNDEPRYVLVFVDQVHSGNR